MSTEQAPRRLDELADRGLMLLVARSTLALGSVGEAHRLKKRVRVRAVAVYAPRLEVLSFGLECATVAALRSKLDRYPAQCKRDK